MANKGKISVELKLQLASLKAQAKEAASILGISMKGSAGKAAAEATNAASTAQEKLKKTTEKTTTALQKQLAEWRKLNAGGVAPGQSVTDVSANTTKNSGSSNPFQQEADKFGKGGVASAGGLPASPVVQKPKLAMPSPTVPNPQFKVSPVQPSGMAAITQMVSGLRNMLLPIGQVIASLYLIKRAIDFVLTPLRMFADMLSKAYEQGRKLYAQSMQSGLSVQGQAKRGALANALGVSEADIFQFGAAIQYLDDSFKVSTRVMAENATRLAAVAWEASATKTAFEALGQQLAGAMAPVIQDAIEGVRLFVETLMAGDIIVGIGHELAAVFQALSLVFQGVLIAVNGLMLGFQLLADSLTWVMIQINNLIAKIPGAGKLGVTAMDDSHAFDGSTKMAEALAKQADHVLEGYKNKKAPEPQAYMKQLPTSAWEKMGLQIGGGGGTNYSMQTANHTKRATTLLEKILSATTSGARFNITKPAGLPATA